MDQTKLISVFLCDVLNFPCLTIGFGIRFSTLAQGGGRLSLSDLCYLSCFLLLENSAARGLVSRQLAGPTVGQLFSLGQSQMPLNPTSDHLSPLLNLMWPSGERNNYQYFSDPLAQVLMFGES